MLSCWNKDYSLLGTIYSLLVAQHWGIWKIGWWFLFPHKTLYNYDASVCHLCKWGNLNKCIALTCDYLYLNTKPFVQELRGTGTSLFRRNFTLRCCCMPTLGLCVVLVSLMHLLSLLVKWPCCLGKGSSVSCAYRVHHSWRGTDTCVTECYNNMAELVGGTQWSKQNARLLLESKRTGVMLKLQFYYAVNIKGTYHL